MIKIRYFNQWFSNYFKYYFNYQCIMFILS